MKVPGPLLFSLLFFLQSLQAQVSLPFGEPFHSAGLPERDGLTLNSPGDARMMMVPGQTESSGSTQSLQTIPGANRFRANVYAVTQDTLLAAHDFYLDRPESQTVLFSVYEAEALAGPYVRVSHVEVFAEAGQGYVSSGDVAVRLQTGHFYLIGAGWTPENTISYNNSGDVEVLSFGTLVEGYLTNGGADPGETIAAPSLINSRYPQRLRTLAGGGLQVPPPGSSSQAIADTLFRGHRIRMDQDQVLGAFRLDLTPTQAMDVTVLVYRSDSEAGVYTQILEETVSVQAGETWVSSSNLRLPLDGGSYYVLGMYWPEDAQYRFQAGAFSAAEQSTDFGAVISGVQANALPEGTLSATYTNTGYAMEIDLSDPGALRMDSSVAGSSSLNLIDLELNLNGIESAELQFEYRAASAGAGSAQVILFDSGNTGFPQGTLAGSTDWQTYTVDLKARAVAEGIDTTSPVYAVIQTSSNNLWPAAGWEIRNLDIRTPPDLIAVSQVPSSVRYTFKGFDSPKEFQLNHTFRLLGGSADLSSRILQATATLNLNPGELSADDLFLAGVPAGSDSTLNRPFTLSVPGSTKLPLTLYSLSLTLDPQNSVPEIREGNNQAVSAVEVNHYSGKLWFQNVEADITITDWDRREFLSSTLHRITGSGSVNGRVFAFEDLDVVKDPVTLDYRLDDDENAFFDLGDLSEQTLAHVRFRSEGSMLLSREGLFADLVVTLPAGSGRTPNPDEIDLDAHITFPAVPLTTSFSPAQNRTLSQVFWIAEESKPLLFEVDELIWNPAEGDFTFRSTGDVQYVRELYLQQLATAVANGFISPEAAVRRSNSAFYRNADLDPGDPVLVETGTGGEARLTAALSILPGDFRAHLPYNSHISWNQKGDLNIVQDLIASGSQLPDAGALALPYDQTCPDGCDGPDALETLTVPEPTDYLFTPQGGLVADGALPVPTKLAWGRLQDDPDRPDFAQQSGDFLQAAFFMSGHFMPGEGSANILGELAPGWLVSLGSVWDDPQGVIDPGMPDFYTGKGRYPGMNFRLLEHPGAKGYQIMGGVVWEPFDLSTRAKYYVRQSGVTGIHEAESFTQSGQIYGYDFSFSNLGFSYLSSTPVPGGSRTNGDLTFSDGPINDVIEFEELMANCRGELGEADPVPGKENLNLEYWNTSVTMYGLDFRRQEGCASGGTLVVTGSTKPDLLDAPMVGELALGPENEILPPARNDIGVTSRFTPPAQVILPGRRGQEYLFFPQVDVYLNDWKTADPDLKDSGEGYFSFAGRLDVPFFEALFTHLHVPAGDGVIYVMGGWPERGWRGEQNQTYFTHPDFDDGHLTWPSSNVNTVAEYRSTTLIHYQPLAVKSIFGLVEVMYPLEWNPAIRTFKSPRPENDRWLATNLDHQVDYMDAEDVEISFGLQYDGLPRLNLTNFVFNELEDQLGIAQAILDAGAGSIMDYLEGGIRSLDKLLKPISGNLAEPLIRKHVEKPLNDLYADLLAEYEDQNEDFGDWLDQQAEDAQSWTNFKERLTNRIRDHYLNGIDDVGVVDDVDGFFDTATGEVDSAINAIDSLIPESPPLPSLTNQNERLLYQDPDSGAFPVAQSLGAQLIGIFAQPLLEAADETTAESLDAVFSQVERPLKAATEELRDVREELVDLKKALNEVEEGVKGDLKKELEALVEDHLVGLDPIEAFANDSVDAVLDYLKNLPPDRNFLDELDPQGFSDLLKEEVVIEFLDSDFHHQVTTALRSRLYDIEGRFRNAVDSTFASINDAMKEELSDVLTGIDDTVNGFAGTLGDYVGSGELDGYAQIRGDSLQRARVDGTFQWKVPDELEFKGFLLIDTITGNGNPICNPGPGPGVEFAQAKKVTVGARELPCSWLGSDITVDIGTSMSFDQINGDDGFPVPVGLGGEFGLSFNSDPITFEEFEITELWAGVAFGTSEGYISSRARVIFNESELAAGVFFGATCNITPLLMVDPDVGNLLGEPPLIGAYVYAEGWIPLVNYSCMLNLAAGVGAGIYFFSDLTSPRTYGMKVLFGAKGDAACVVTARGEVRMTGGRRDGRWVANGTGTLSGTVGDCDWVCFRFRTQVSVTYDDGDLDVSY